MPRYPIVAIFVLPLVLSSCAGGGDDHLSTYTVSRTNFENYIMLDGAVEPVRSTNMTFHPRAHGAVTYIIEDGTFIEEGDTLAILEAEYWPSYYDHLSDAIESNGAELTKLKANLDMQFAILEAQVQNNEADTKIALLDSLQLIYSPPNQRKVRELQLERVAIEKERYEKKLEALKIINQSEVRTKEIEIQQLGAHLQSTREILDATVLRAPKKGLALRAVNRMTGKKYQEGDNVFNNMTVIQIPDMEEVKVKIMAPEWDYKAINVGDSVVHTFDAAPGNLAYGKITMKSPVGQPYKQGAKVKYFEIEASIDSMSTLPEPGFSANCRIIMKQGQDTLVIPQIAVFDQGSAKIVFVKRDKGRGYEMRQVITGLSSQKETVVTAGLQAGETILLSRPPESQIKEQTFLPRWMTAPEGDSIPSFSPEYFKAVLSEWPPVKIFSEAAADTVSRR